MNSLDIQGDIPLNGEVKLSGSAVSASKIILGCLFTTEEVFLLNVPNVRFVQETLDLIKALGADFEWVDDNKLKINTAGVSTSRVPFDLGSNHRDTFLIAAPLIFRFGKAIIPQPSEVFAQNFFKSQAISTWESLGMNVSTDQEWIKVESGNAEASNLSFKQITPFNTVNAIFSSLFLKGKSVVTNAAEEYEVEDLISFVNSLGAQVERVEPRRLEIRGENLFKGTSHTVENEADEAVFFAIAALLTGGTVTIKDVNKIAIASFINILNKMGTNFEFASNDLTVWHGGEEFQPVDVTSKPAPGFLKDWIPSLVLLLTQANGTSNISYEYQIDNCGYVSDFNRMGADIDFEESEGELINYKSGIEIHGATSLKGSTLDIMDHSSGVSLILAALAASGKSEVRGSDLVERVYENFVKKLIDLGARIS